MNALNKAAGKVVTVQGKLAANGQKAFSNDKGSAVACIAADGKQKVAGAMAKALSEETKKCSAAPSFGAGSSGLDAANASTEATLGFARSSGP